VNSQHPQSPGRGPRDAERGGRAGGGRPGGKGRRDERAPSSGGQRVVVELSSLEKALGKGDLEGQLRPLDEVVRALRTLRVKSLAELEPNARGRLITTLLRVSRQPKPAPPPTAAESSPAPEEGTAEATPAADEAEAPVAEAPVAEAPRADVALEEAAPASAGAAEEVAETKEEAPAPPAEGEPAAAPASSPSAPPALAPAQLHADVLYRVGLAWLAVHEAERAEAAFGASGRTPSREELASAEASAPQPEGARHAPGAHKPGPERKKPTRGRERPGPMPAIAPGDWQAQAGAYASRGRTRDAARLHERHGSPAEALKLYEAGGDLKSALRVALTLKDMEVARRLAVSLPAAEARAQLERAEAWELLMELLVKGNAFDDVAKLYERARQFDQAALAWERAGKLGLARKAFERAHDAAGAERLRALEVQRLVERGDRLGAAQVLVQSNRRTEAADVLKTLPATKAFRFLEQLKLKDEARLLGEAELAAAKGEAKPGVQARWLELLGRKAEAVQAWEEAGRKDRAYPLLETLGDFAKAGAFAEASGHRDQAIRLYRRAGDDRAAERLEATPPSTPPPAPAEDAHMGDTGAPETETGSTPTPTV
jgi:tetratricopeptide (TPR) repeat protein